MTLSPLFIRLNQPIAIFCSSAKMFSKKVRAVEIGKREPCRSDSAYSSGQLFIHRVLDYRGIILFAWETRLFDRDAELLKPKSGFRPTETKLYSFEPEMQWYYQALVDQRDWGNVRLQVENLSYLGVHNNRGQYYRDTFEGFDHVSHEDVLPYASSERVAFCHDMFDTFFSPHQKDVLRTWRDDNVYLLNLTSVYRQTTDNIRVTVIPFYLGSNSVDDINYEYWWRSCVRVESLRTEPCRVKETEWKIKGHKGTVTTKREKGVLSQEPILSLGQKAFQYSDYVRLPEPRCTLWGHLKIEKESGDYFKVYVPPCELKTNQKDDSNSISSM